MKEEASLKNFIALAIGAFCGTILRYGMGKIVMPLSNGFPLGTLLINLTGCLFLGWFFTIVLFRWNLPLSIRLGIDTGFIGSFTTFSTFSVETINLIEIHHEALALIYVLISIVGGIASTAIGFAFAKLQTKAKKEGEPA